MLSNEIYLARLCEETERLCRRYVDEIVVPFALCPWAAPALADGRVQTLVITSKILPAPQFETAAREVLDLLDGVSQEVDLVLVVLPLAPYSRLEMDDLLRAVRQRNRPVGLVGADRDRESVSEPAFALAAFHPDAPADPSTPERLIPYLRRTPDPMIQAVRIDALAKLDPDRGAGTAFVDLMSLEELRLDRPPPKTLRLRIAEANLVTVADRREELEERYRDIFDDHRRTRERLEKESA